MAANEHMTAHTSTIYIPLLDEGTEVWRPVNARDLGGGVYEISSDAAPEEHEQWAFAPGERVRTALRALSGGEPVLVASERVVPAI
jgi:hypothetical protein